LFGSENKIDVADPPFTTLVMPAVDPIFVHDQTADGEHCILTDAAAPPPAQSESMTGEALERPPSGVNVTDDLP
jgi:hypothetical protein